MNSQSLRSPASASRTDKAMTSEQFTQVIEAILAGKYSWACLLILRFAGYNPLHYIPYRTFNRLVKENTPSRKSKSVPPEPSAKRAAVTPHQAHAAAQNALDQIPDLAYLENLAEEPARVKGGGRGAFDWAIAYRPRLYR